MSKRWITILLLAFALGMGLKAYLNTTEQNQTTAHVSTLFSKGTDQTVNLFDQQDPRIRIVYFGFTHCPDVCPTSLAMLAGALNQLDEKTLEQFRPIFISLDPERDTGEKTQQYAQYFHPSLEGLSADMTITKPLAERYGVIFKRTELAESELKYTLDHNSYFYFLKPDGTLITKVPHTLTPAPIVHTIQTITAQEQP